MPYTTQAEIEAEIPAPHLVDATDDDRDGLADAGVLDQIISNAGAAVDGLIAGGMDLPLDEPYPASVRRAALVFACETIYRRRQVPDDQNPFRQEGNDWRKFLSAVGDGDKALDSTLTADYGGPAKIATRIP